MKEFRDYSTYLHKIVRYERAIHDLCNDRKYGEASIKTSELSMVVEELKQWLDELVKGNN